MASPASSIAKPIVPYGVRHFFDDGGPTTSLVLAVASDAIGHLSSHPLAGKLVGFATILVIGAMCPMTKRPPSALQSPFTVALAVYAVVAAIIIPCLIIGAGPYVDLVKEVACVQLRMCSLT